VRGIFRAAFQNVTSGSVRQGASTITQQLVKNFFLTSERTLRRKVKEIFMSLLLELHFSKDEILEAYLNEIYMGQDGARAVHGFGLASHFYFNKPLAELKAHEIAMLVGIVKGPSQFDPRRRPERVRERRDLVLKIWADAGLIRPEEYESATALPLGLSGSGRGGVERYPAFVQLVTRQLKDQYPDEALTHEGLRIFTTLRPRVQEALEQRLVTDLPELEKARKLKAGTLEAAGVVTSAEGGEVQAVVGGRDTRFAGFNRALDSRRSIGSLAKPFVYLTALMSPERYRIDTAIPDEPITVKLSKGNVWSPANYDKRLHGNVPLYVALAESYNLPTVRLGLDLGVDKVQKTFAGAGYFEAPPLPSIFLGALDMSPVEVAQVYNTLAASGYQTPLSAIREVLNKDGKPLQRYPFKVKQTLPEGPVYLTTWALRKVLEFGTARAAYNVIPPSTRLAGKTGTTDDLRDSWFAGYSADQVAVIWLGRDEIGRAHV
jgi:penicillin-binding protein 1B